MPPMREGMRILVSGDWRSVEKDWGMMVRPDVPGMWRNLFRAAGWDFEIGKKVDCRERRFI